MEIETNYGKVPLERLVQVYETYRTQEAKKAEKKKAYLQTEEGKEWNRKHSREYYAKNKERIKAKAKARYVPKKPQTEGGELEIEPVPIC